MTYPTQANSTGQYPSGGRTGRGGGPGDVIPKGYRKGRIQQFDPNQMQLYKSLFSNVGPGSYLSRLAGGDQEIFNQIEAPALQQFSGLLGGLGSKFSGMGMGARRSSGFQNEATSAASNFAQQLQAQRQGLQRQAMMDMMDISNTLLNQRPYENILTQKQQKPNFWGDIAGKFAGAIPGAIVGGLTGGPVGAAAGGFSGFMNTPSSSASQMDMGFRSGAPGYYF